MQGFLRTHEVDVDTAAT